MWLCRDPLVLTKLAIEFSKKLHKYRDHDWIGCYIGCYGTMNLHSNI